LIQKSKLVKSLIQGEGNSVFFTMLKFLPIKIIIDELPIAL